jgi:hypothetical protein
VANKEISKMMEKIRNTIAECKADEKAVLEELVAEAEGWNMRLEEIEQEEKSE